MGQAAYPNAADLASYLMAADLDVDGLDLETAAAAGVERYERKVNRKMLVSGSATVRTYDPPTGVNPLLEIHDAASVSGVQYVPFQAVPLVFTQNVDYWLYPLNASALQRPVTSIQFWLRWAEPLSPFLKASIQVTAAWGYGSTLSEEVWEAMLCEGCLRLLPQIVQRVTQGALKVAKPGPNDVWFERQPLQGLQKYWQDVVDRSVADVRRLWI